MEPVQIKRLTPEHAGAYRALMLEAYELHPDAFTSSIAERRPLPLDWWAGRVSEGEGTSEVVFGAFVAAGLAGVAGLVFETREKSRHKATLFGMYVPCECRQRGLGRRLVMAALAYAGSRPQTVLVQLTVTEGNAPAQRLYEACGFVSFGIEPLAVKVRDRYVSKVHMWRKLGASNRPVERLESGRIE